MAVKVFPITEFLQDQSREQQVSRLRFLTHELDRLLRYPGLFPSRVTQVRFFAIIGADAELQFVKSCKELLIQAEMRKLALMSRRMFTRKTFQPGSKNWENFLLDGGIGTSHRALQSVPKSVFQVIPAVGMRIIGDYEREENEIVRFVEQSQLTLNVEPAATTLMINFDKPTPPEEVIPDIVLPQQSQAMALRPNPFRNDLRIRMDLVQSGPELLETFSAFVYRLEHPPPPPGVVVPPLNAPNMFPLITLRSWHPPAKLRDLRFLP